MSTKKIDVAIAYDQQLIADGLVLSLSREEDINIVACLQNNDSLVNKLAQIQINIVILECARWPNHYLGYMENISKALPEAKLLVISELLKYANLVEVLKIAHGYLLRTCSIKKVILALREINISGKYLCPKEVDEFINSKKENIDKRLTLRENEILTHWLLSYDNNKIADNLNICESTVRSHLKNIRRKIKSNNKIQMLVYACKNNILNNGMNPICPNCKYSCSEVSLDCN